MTRALKDPSFNCQIIHTLHERMRTVLCSVYLTAMWNRAKRRRTIKSFLLSFDSRSYSLLFIAEWCVSPEFCPKSWNTANLLLCFSVCTQWPFERLPCKAGTLHASPSATPITAPLLSTIPKTPSEGKNWAFSGCAIDFSRPLKVNRRVLKKTHFKTFENMWGGQSWLILLSRPSRFALIEFFG